MTNISSFKTIYPEEVYSIPSLVNVVIDTPWTELPAEHQQLLSKILASVRLSLDSVRIVYQRELDLSFWNEKPSRLVAFVQPPKGIETYEALSIGNTSMVLSEPLSSLVNDEASKRKLWDALRNLFAA